METIYRSQEIGPTLPVLKTEGQMPRLPRILEIPRTQTYSDLLQQRSFEYEQEGIINMGRSLDSDKFVVGPALLEAVFRGTSKLSLPDAMVFQPYDDSFVLERLTEFKWASSRFNSTNKLDGLKRTVDMLRKNPSFLSSRITATLGGIEIPRLLMPHNDNDIEVNFVSPRILSEGTLVDFDTEFGVSYSTFPEPQAA